MTGPWGLNEAGIKVVARLQAENERQREALNKPLRETILAVLRHMPAEAAPDHLAAQIESQVRAWQALSLDASSDPSRGVS